MIIKCPECGHQVSDRAPICPSCGVEIAGHIVKCRHCGEMHLVEDVTCPSCHHNLTGGPEELTHKPAVADDSPIYDEDEDVYEDDEETDDEELLADDDEVQEAVPVRDHSEPVAADAKPKKNYGALLVAFLIAAILMAVFLYFYHDSMERDEAKQYNVALKETNPLILQEYLNNYGNSNKEHATIIQHRLDSITTQKPAAKPAQPKEEVSDTDEADWQTAVKANTSDAYAEYLVKHENGKHKDEADAALRQLARSTIVSPEDVTQAKNAVRSMLVAMNSHNASQLTGTLAAKVNYGGQADQSPSVVVDYMEHLYSSSTRLNWYLDQGEPTVTKADGTLTIDIPARLSQNLKEGGNAQNTFAIHATLDAEGKIAAVTFNRK